MANVKIQALDNGPFVVKGEVDILNGEGKLIETREEAYLCRCGASQAQPYCDGTHEGKFYNEVR